LDPKKHYGRVMDIFMLNSLSMKYFIIKMRTYYVNGIDNGYGFSGLEMVNLLPDTTQRDIIIPCDAIERNVHIAPVNWDYKIQSNKIKYGDKRNLWEPMSYRDWEINSLTDKLVVIPLI